MSKSGLSRTHSRIWVRSRKIQKFPVVTLDDATTKQDKLKQIKLLSRSEIAGSFGFACLISHFFLCNFSAIQVCRSLKPQLGIAARPNPFIYWCTRALGQSSFRRASRKCWRTALRSNTLGCGMGETSWILRPSSTPGFQWWEESWIVQPTVLCPLMLVFTLNLPCRSHLKTIWRHVFNAVWQKLSWQQSCISATSSHEPKSLNKPTTGCAGWVGISQKQKQAWTTFKDGDLKWKNTVIGGLVTCSSQGAATPQQPKFPTRKISVTEGDQSLHKMKLSTKRPFWR